MNQIFPEKRCRTCGVYKPATQDHFHPRYDVPNRVTNQCKECRRTAARQRYYDKVSSDLTLQRPVAMISQHLRPETTHKQCNTCREILPLADFHKKGRSGKKGLPKLLPKCKHCTKKKPRACMSDHERYISERFNSLRTGARKRNIPFNITKGDLEELLENKDEVCPYLNVPIGNGSIDRIDNNKGYEIGNLRVISCQANKMKSDATREELLAFAKGILELHK